MKNIILILFLLLPFLVFSQDFNAQWVEFDKASYESDLVKKGKILDDILAKAKPETYPIDWLEASKQKLILQLRYKEINQDSVFQSWENLITKHQAPLKNLISATLAELYLLYAEHHSTNVISASDTFPLKATEWSKIQFEKRILKLSRQSCDNYEKLRIPSNQFKRLFPEVKGFTEKVSPFLSDLLIHKHIQVLTQLRNSYGEDQTGWASSNKTDQSYFLIGKKFADASLPEQRPEILYWFQVLQKQNLTNVFVSSWLELHRFIIMKNLGFDQTKLKFMQEEYLKLFDNQPFSAEMTVLYASNYLKKVETLKLCKAKVAQFQDEYTASCKNLINSIESKKIDFYIPERQVFDKNHLMSFSIKNVKQVFYRIYKRVEGDWAEHYLSKKEIKSGNFIFPDYFDYENHTISMTMPNLGKGSWVMLLSHNQNFVKENNIMILKRIDVFPYTLSAKNLYSSDFIDSLCVLDQAGKPVANEPVELTLDQDKSLVKTNERGMVYINQKSKVYNKYSKFRIISPNQNFASYSNDQYLYAKSENTNESAHLLTDRAIYRPGQKIYFKAISRKEVGFNNFEVLPGAVLKFYFYSNNGEISSMEMISNDFGSCDSFFVAPEGITGQYYITCSVNNQVGGQVYFRIEEYKRPQFKAEIEIPTAAYKLGDKIELKGKAVFYHGSPVQNAQVKLTVQRSVSSWYYYFSNSKTLIDTTVQTNEKGEFPIQFIAEFVENNNKKGLNYSFSVHADISDLTGETQTASYQLNLSDAKYRLSANTNAQWINSEDFKLHVNAISSAGKPIPTSFVLKAYKLEKKSFNLSLFTMFQSADTFLGDKSLFAKQYPYYHLKNNNSTLYDTVWTNLNKEIQFDGDTLIKFSNAEFSSPGSYEFVLFDKEHEATIKVPMQIYFKNNPTAVKFEMLKAIKEEKNYKVGDIAEWGISSDTSLWIRMETLLNDSVIQSEWIHLNKETRWIQMKVTPAMLGDFDVHFSSLFNNHWLSQNLHFSVPLEKTLDLEWISWRDKTEPGSQEKWKLKVSHLKKPVQAEILSVMYDKSLDVFGSNQWYFWPYRSRYSNDYWSGLIQLSQYSNLVSSFKTKNFYDKNYFSIIKIFKQNVWPYRYDDWAEDDAGFAGGAETESVEYEDEESSEVLESPKEVQSLKLEESTGRKNGNKDQPVATKTLADQTIQEKFDKKEDFDEEKPISLRKNLSELAYFYPSLRTDNNGEVWIEFTMPEALTEWKMMNLAHTKDFKIGQNQAITVTAKDLMVLPFTPRFFRMSDTIYFSANVFNQTEQNLNATAYLEFFNPLNDSKVDLKTPSKTLKLNAKAQENLSWKIVIPNEYAALGYKIWVKTDKHTDGQEAIIPVLSNQILVSESQPITVNPGKKTEVEIVNVSKSESKTLKPHLASLEITPNPAWFAVMALPYLAEFPHECSEQMFARYYANSLALNVIEKNPEIESVFKSWKNDTTESRLMRNEELKSLLKNETPWVLELDGEAARKKQMANVFEKSKLTSEMSKTLKILMERQMSNGAWPWFPGGESSFYITQHILTGFGKLKKAGIDVSELEAPLKNGQNYLIQSIDEWIKKYPNNWYSDYYSLNTLYCLSFYPDFERKWKTEMLQKLVLENPENLGLWRCATAVVILKRFGKSKEAEKFVKFLVMSAIQDELKGMYYKSNVYGFSWWQDPIETQVRVIEAMEEMGEKVHAKQLRLWLLGQKRKSDWGTTKNTTEAISVLLNDEKLLSNNEIPNIVWGGKKVNAENFPDLNQEVGTGQFVIHQKSEAATKEFAKVEVKNNGKTQMWGGLHFKYFEDMDKIKSSGSSALKVRKEMYYKVGKDWILLKPETQLTKGDQVTVRIIIETDQAMDFIHICDYRASAFEPAQQLSGYQWKNSLGFYQAPKDIGTHFFLDYLPAGKNILEYELKTVHSGQFSNGNVMIESMYAPEFKTQSSGGRVVVK